MSDATGTSPVSVATATAGLLDERPAKPECRGEGEVGEYDLGLHVLALCKSDIKTPFLFVTLLTIFLK